MARTAPFIGAWTGNWTISHNQQVNGEISYPNPIPQLSHVRPSFILKQSVCEYISVFKSSLMVNVCCIIVPPLNKVILGKKSGGGSAFQ